MNFFHSCFTEADIKRRYRDLCKEHHPNLGGDEETMKAINLEYEERLRVAWYRHRAEYISGTFVETAEGAPKESKHPSEIKTQNLK
jgi:hypothetical protein